MHGRLTRELVLIALAGALLGLGVAWAADAFAIPKFFVQAFFLTLFLAVAAFAVWAAWGYYRAHRDDDWD
jgi:hypothetical protein